MLARNQFEALRACSFGQGGEISEGTGAPAAVLEELEGLGYIDGDRSLTDEGWRALAPYRVDNAVILAAGMATRLAPLSFEKPKAMFQVRGEILIERAIRQIRGAGIRDIVVVVGHMKEAFFYLEDEFGVKIVINPDYATRNNHSSVWCAREHLGNTYILSSDQYYADNIFSKYNYEAYSSAVFVEGATDEQVLTLDADGSIVGMERGGKDAYVALGPAYFDRDFSRKYIQILGEEYDRPETAPKLWEQVFAEHASELRMSTRVFDADEIWEFDYLTDLVSFDRDFFVNVDSAILDNICKTLGCDRTDIVDVAPVNAGLTNLSTSFSVDGVRYIYRHPGSGTDGIINREAEVRALQIARDIGLDDTYVFENPQEGWKISRFIEGCTEFDYADRSQVERALRLVRKLHLSGETMPWKFDFHDEGIALADTLRALKYPLPRDFDALTRRVGNVVARMGEDAAEPVLCHNDFYGPNLLVRDDAMRLIDWEYAAMGDPMCDLGSFVAQGSGYSVEEALGILPLYFGRAATPREQRHFLAAVGLVGWYWYVWAMYKEAVGNPAGEGWLYSWYKAAKQFTAAAEDAYSIERPDLQGIRERGDLQ